TLGAGYGMMFGGNKTQMNNIAKELTGSKNRQQQIIEALKGGDYDTAIKITDQAEAEFDPTKVAANNKPKTPEKQKLHDSIVNGIVEAAPDNANKNTKDRRAQTAAWQNLRNRLQEIKGKNPEEEKRLTEKIEEIKSGKYVPRESHSLEIEGSEVS